MNTVAVLMTALLTTLVTIAHNATPCSGGALPVVHAAAPPLTSIASNGLPMEAGDDLNSVEDLFADRYDVLNEDPNIEENKLALLTQYLIQTLREDPWVEHPNPIVYVEDYNIPGEDADIGFVGNPLKRSRYYRRYPWKRQNSRSRTSSYEADNKYMCQPSREDVFQLLVALHESRQGNRAKTVNFCNRRRPASAIFTNIRFLGRRK